MTEDEMIGWHHRLDGHEFEQVPGVGDGQGGLACCSPWGRTELDTTKRLNNNNPAIKFLSISTKELKTLLIQNSAHGCLKQLCS